MLCMYIMVLLVRSTVSIVWCQTLTTFVIPRAFLSTYSPLLYSGCNNNLQCIQTLRISNHCECSRTFPFHLVLVVSVWNSSDGFHLHSLITVKQTQQRTKKLNNTTTNSFTHHHSLFENNNDTTTDKTEPELIHCQSTCYVCMFGELGPLSICFSCLHFSFHFDWERNNILTLHGSFRWCQVNALATA